MGSGDGGSRVSIPNIAWKTIQDIREITGKQHSDDEIYTVLKECSMDPNETAQKLLYLDTFHEVKSRRDRRKENLNSRGPDESRLGTGIHRRVVRGGGQDIASRRNFGRRENGASNVTERYPMSSSLRVPPKTKSGAASRMTKYTVIPNGFTNLSNGSSSHGYDHKSSSGSDGCLVDINKLGGEAPQSAVATSHSFGSLGNEQGKSASKADKLPTFSTPAAVYSVADSGVAPSPLGHSAFVSSTDSEEGSKQRTKPNHTGSITNLNIVNTGLSNSEKVTHVTSNNMHKRKSSSKSTAHESKQFLENSHSPPSLTYDGDSVGRPSHVDGQSPQESLVHLDVVVGSAVEAISQSIPQSNVFDGQPVTFPNHFQVPEALKNGLTFGSFDAAFGLQRDSVNVGDDNTIAIQSSQDIGKSVTELSSDKNMSLTSERVSPNHSQCLPLGLKDSSSPEVNVPAGMDPEAEPPKQEIHLPQEGFENPLLVNGPNYSIGVIPSMVGNQQLVSLNGHEPQAHETSFSSGNTQALSAANPASPALSSITVSPYSVPFYRQTYPPNFFPYGQYISPVYMPPMHQFLYHNGFPAQPSIGNVFLSPAAAAAAGVKFSLPQLKPGTNAGNITHIGLHSGSSFITAPVGCGPESAVTSGSSMGNEDNVASQLKESQIYSTGQRTEGSAVWIHTPGQDISSLPVNPLYNLPPQGHHATFSPAQGHGAFSGIYPSGHTLTAPSNLLQQSQLMAGAVETIGPPPGAYQQAQHAQINWNTAF